MATQIGINERSFVEVNLDDLQHLQRCFGEYIKDLTVRNKSKRKSETAGQPTQATMVPADVPKEMPADVPTDMPAISVTADGFPVVPDIEFNKRSKQELEGLMRSYLGRHYGRLCDFPTISLLIRAALASKGVSRHVPFGSFKDDIALFIQKNYIPAGLVLHDPHNMKKQDIVDFLNHITSRQSLFGAAEAFQFCSFRKNGRMHPATYPAVSSIADVTSQPPRSAMAPTTPAQPALQILPQHVMSGYEDPLASGTIVHANDETRCVIDPKLLTQPTVGMNAEGAVRPQTHQTGINPNDADYMHMVMVNQQEITTLMDHGLASVHPINGPNDGPPMYLIPAKTQADLVNKDVVAVPVRRSSRIKKQ